MSALLVKTTDNIRRTVATSAKAPVPIIDKNGCLVAQDDSFKFWHEKEHGAATLRPRVRKYEYRKPHVS